MEKFAVWHVEVGTVGFHSEAVARDLFTKLDGPARLFKIEDNGKMVLLEEK